MARGRRIEVKKREWGKRITKIQISYDNMTNMYDKYVLIKKFKNTKLKKLILKKYKGSMDPIVDSLKEQDRIWG